MRNYFVVVKKDHLRARVVQVFLARTISLVQPLYTPHAVRTKLRQVHECRDLAPGTVVVYQCRGRRAALVALEYPA